MVGFDSASSGADGTGSSGSDDGSVGVGSTPPMPTVSASGEPPMPTTASTTAPMMTSASTSPPTASATDPSISASATATTGPPPGGLPNGSNCFDSSECQSLHCFQLGPLGGICGECETDADCDGGGCSPPDPFSGTGSTCNFGLLGDGCESDDACGGVLFCASILDIPGVLSASTCSQCITDTHCASGICNPFYILDSFTGVRLCVNPGSVPLGEGCDFDASGDVACASGHCAAADLFGVATVGVCSECEVSGDCPAMQTCFPPVADPSGLIAGFCG